MGRNGRYASAWPTSGRTATMVVAASDSSAQGRRTADYRCDGTNDDVEINAAITAMGAVRGRVVLLEGTFVLNSGLSLPSDVTLEGQGDATVLKIKNGKNADISVIENSDQTNGNTRIRVQWLRIDGNKANNSAVTQRGIDFTKVTHSRITGVTIENPRSGGMYLVRCDYCKIINNTANDTYSQGITLDGCSWNLVQGNTTKNNTGGDGINAHNTAAASLYNIFADNICEANGDDGLSVTNSSYCVVVGNFCRGNTDSGISIFGDTYCTVSGNVSQGNGGAGIDLKNNSAHNVVTGNVCTENSQTTTNTADNIWIDTNSDYNYITGNVCRKGGLTNQPRYGIRVNNANCDGNLIEGNDLYDSGATANLSDVGTGTVIRRNRGWVTEVNVLSGTFAVDSTGMKTVTIAHGCNYTPAIQDCQVSLVKGTDVTDWRVTLILIDAVDATNVTVKVNLSSASATPSATATAALRVAKS